MWGEADITQSTPRAVGSEGLLHEDVETDLEISFADNFQERFLIGDRSSRDVDEDAAGANRAQELFGDAAGGVWIERRELDDDIVFSEEGFERFGYASTDLLGGGFIEVGGEDGYIAIEGLDEFQKLSRDGTVAVDTDFAFEERLYLIEVVFAPTFILMQLEGPVSGSPEAGEGMKERTFGDGAADGWAPVGDEKSVFQLLASDQSLHGAGEVAHVAQFRGQFDGQGESFPATDQHIGIDGGNFGSEVFLTHPGGVDQTKLRTKGLDFAEKRLGEEPFFFARSEDGEERGDARHKTTIGW